MSLSCVFQCFVHFVASSILYIHIDVYIYICSIPINVHIYIHHLTESACSSDYWDNADIVKHVKNNGIEDSRT